MTAAATRASTQVGASTSSERREESMSSRSRSTCLGAGSPSARTRARALSGAAFGSARRSRTSSANSRSKSTSVVGIAHHLLESFQGPTESRRAGGRADSEQTGHRRAIELEEDAEGHGLPLDRR